MEMIVFIKFHKDNLIVVHRLCKIAININSRTFSVTKMKLEPIKSKQALQPMGQLLLQMLVLNLIRKQLKSWLRAIPTYESKWHIQSNFDVFCFRINRSRANKVSFTKQ